MNYVPALSLREKISLVALKLIHDIESNPGPCSQVGVTNDIYKQVRILFHSGRVSGWESAWSPKWLPFPRFRARSLEKVASRFHVH